MLVNPAAAGGRGGELLPRVERALQARGVAFRTVLTRGIEHGCAEAVAAARAGETCVVMGGDGLVGQVGGALADGDVPLGVIPAGRGNDLARVLGIPTEPEAAVAVIAGARVRQIDVGEANDRRFLGIASCGFDSDANRIANQARWVRGRLVYAYAALRALAAWKPARFTLTLDGVRHELTGYSVAVANSRAYGGGMMIAPDAALDDGLLDVVSTGQVGKLRFLANLPKVFAGTHVDEEPVSVERAAEVRIDADRPFAVYADGDRLTELPVTVRLLRRALAVLVPEGE
ncbi:MAG: YegS/Rv2252/BmrU family lipid kinase [Solirubrobacterales bacterium]|nr:YegS/Rv2252/BmrU family lipid kinase [Solirubrobacterales bacterium]